MEKEKFGKYKTKKIDNLNTKCDICSKVEIVGDCQVGKSSIAKKLSKNIFSSEYIPTSGYELYPYIIKVEDKYIKFQIWDMCGNENYRSALFNLYKNATFGILVYSITDYKSFENLENWITKMKENASPNNKIILLGNKVDEEEKRVVTFDEGKQLCKKYNLELFMEVSAKEGFNNPNFVDISAINLYEEYIQLADKTDSTFINNESIALSEVNEKKRPICCL